MNSTVQKWGNSLALRIPRSLAKDIRLHQGSVVDISIIEGKIMLNPRRKRRHNLLHLLKAVSKKNIHSEFEWGKPSGKEAW